jgi:FkbM family methyltransferase
MIIFFTWDTWAIPSWSQEGEDMILRRIFEKKENGFYVDVGAHHPKRFSNTYFFYKRGWRGINVDAMPGSMKLFSKLRRRDKNIEVGISSKEGYLDYYIFNEPALNGFSKEISNDRDKKSGKYNILDIKNVRVTTLAAILEEHLPVNKKIDFLSIDVEGLDVEVLESNDWNKFRPKVVLVELIGLGLNDILTHTATLFLHKKGYILYAKCVHSVFYIEK